MREENLMGMTQGDIEAWLDEQESQQERDAFVEELKRLFSRDRQAVMDAFQTLPTGKWKPSGAEIKKGIFTYDDFLLDTLRRAVEGGDSPTEE